MSLRIGQFTTVTPWRYLDPSTRSTFCSSATRIISGRYFGSWEKSASISTTNSASVSRSAHWNPST